MFKKIFFLQFLNVKKKKKSTFFDVWYRMVEEKINVLNAVLNLLFKTKKKKISIRSVEYYFNICYFVFLIFWNNAKNHHKKKKKFIDYHYCLVNDIFICCFVGLSNKSMDTSINRLYLILIRETNKKKGMQIISKIIIFLQILHQKKNIFFFFFIFEQVICKE